MEYIVTIYEFKYKLSLYFKCILVMGGGVGISAFSKLRVATENKFILLLEAKIGLFTDVGSSYSLSRMKDNMGIIFN